MFICMSLITGVGKDPGGDRHWDGGEKHHNFDSVKSSLFCDEMKRQTKILQIYDGSNIRNILTNCLTARLSESILGKRNFGNLRVHRI